jgi:TldD protein
MVDYLDRGRSVLGHFSPEKGDFLDVRFFIGETTNIAIRNGVADQTSSQANVGAALRGAWGFSTTTSFGEDALLDAMWTAVNMAKAMARSIGEPGVVPEEYVYEGNVSLKVASDPREIAMEEKIRVAVELEEHIRGVSDRIKVSTASLSDTVRREVIVNSLGTEVDVSNCYISVRGNATAREGPLIQNAGESVGSTWGWETVEEVDTAEMGALVGKRAVALLGAERPPSGRLDIVMDPSLVGLFIHEAFGHAMEADAIQGNMSVLKDKIGREVGVPEITVIDDPTVEGLRGYYPYDSEGTKTRRRVMVEDGVQKEFYHSLETAARMGVEPNGAARAMDYNWKPIVRMGNTYIDSGDMSLEELCQEVGDGVYLKKSGGGYVNPSIGQFFFSTQEGQVIKDGELGPLTQNVAMSGMTLEVLANVMGVGKESKMRSGSCGKGSQTAPVGMGGPNMAVKGVVVGGR